MVDDVIESSSCILNSNHGAEIKKNLIEVDAEDEGKKAGNSISKNRAVNHQEYID